jgi:hypothetical protein
MQGQGAMVQYSLIVPVIATRHFHPAKILRTVGRRPLQSVPVIGSVVNCIGMPA